MTTYTDHGLACLAEAGYAAVALAMQHDALATEAALDAVSDALDTVYLRPMATGVTTSASGPLSSAGETIYSISGWTVGNTNMATVTTAPAGLRITIPATGWYTYTLYAPMTAAGAVTAFSRRTLYGRVTRRVFTATTQLLQNVWRTVDTNTAGEHLTVTGSYFYATVGQTIDVEGYWSHANAASNVSVPAGSRLAVWYLGSGINIGST